jgi:allophanate hydrolase subunit 2
LELPVHLRLAYDEHPVVEVVLGPQAAAFTEAGLAAFLEGEYALTPACDRMGYRLAGPIIGHRASPDLLSEGIALGAIQVPGDGQPIVLMADRQTAGGYPKIGVVTGASLPLIVQCPPARGRVRFQPVPVEQAQQQWREIVSQLRALT